MTIERHKKIISCNFLIWEAAVRNKIWDDHQFMKHFKFGNMDLVCSPYVLTFEKDKEFEVPKPLKLGILKFSMRAQELSHELRTEHKYVCKKCCCCEEPDKKTSISQLTACSADKAIKVSKKKNKVPKKKPLAASNPIYELSKQKKKPVYRDTPNDFLNC